MNVLIAESSVVHIHGLWQEHVPAAVSAAGKAGVPYLISAHGMLGPWALRAKRWKKEVYSMLFERRRLAGASALRALTRSEVDDYRRFGLTVPSMLIPNGIDLPGNPSPELFLEAFPGLAERRLIIYLGRLNPTKGLDLLINAWSRIESRFPDAQLVLAGPDQFGTQASLAKLAGSLGIGNRVTFTGLVVGELKWSAIAASDLLVLPPKSEGFSVAVLESLACSKPVILTRQCNFPDVSLHQAGITIEPNETQLGNALTEILKLATKDREAMGKRGRDLVRSKYSQDAVARSMADVYDWLLGGSVPQGIEIYQ